MHNNLCITFILLICLSGHLLEPWIRMFVAWKYCREEDKRRINLVRKIFFAHFEANEKILYKAAKISAQEALKKQLENKWIQKRFLFTIGLIPIAKCPRYLHNLKLCTVTCV